MIVDRNVNKGFSAEFDPVEGQITFNIRERSRTNNTIKKTFRIPESTFVTFQYFYYFVLI